MCEVRYQIKSGVGGASTDFWVLRGGLANLIRLNEIVTLLLSDSRRSLKLEYESQALTHSPRCSTTPDANPRSTPGSGSD